MKFLLYAGFAGALLAGPAAAEKPDDTGYSAEDAKSGARLRAEAGVAVATLFHPCGEPDGLTAVKERYVALRDRHLSHRQKMNFIIAKADYDYQMSLIDINCPVLTDDERLEMDELNAAVANAAMDRIEIAIANMARTD